MPSYWRVVNEVIEESDILLEVLDARFIDDTRNKEIEAKIKKAKKILIYVVNKCDLIEKEESEKIKKSLRPSAFISATERLGTSYLRDEIIKQIKLNKIEGRVTVGVLGYPNVGKSSVINSLKGKAITGTSSQSGFTKGKQMIKISQRLYLMDTPGVIPYKEKDEKKHIASSTLSFSQVKRPANAVMTIIEKYPGVIEKHYLVSVHENSEETVEAIAVKFKKLKKGGIPNTEATARMILKDWQKGNIKK